MNTTAKLDLTLYVHAHFNAAGQFDGYHVNANWKYAEEVREHGVYICIMEQKVQLDVPEDETMMRTKATNVVDETMRALAAKHHARMTTLLGLKNRLLCLAAPDILDAGASASLDVLADDDDIPF